MDLQKQSKKLLYETLSKQFPESSISEDQIERARWRWEFLRLNEGYRKKCLDLKVETILITPQQNEFGTSWVNPKLSFDEVLQIVRDGLKGVKVDDKDKAIRFFALHHFGLLSQPAVGIVGEQGNTIGLQINLNLPDRQILKEVAEILTTRRAAIGKGRPFKKLAEFHRAYILNREYGSKTKVARIMFPEPEYSADEISEDDSAQMEEADRHITAPEAAIKRVERYLKEAKKLIEGGYRHI
jgi:hypothetical protein